MKQTDFFQMTDGASEQDITEMMMRSQVQQFSAAVHGKEKIHMRNNEQKPIKRHSTKRGMLAGLAGAAAVLICGTVTVGAISNWHYTEIFSRMFTERSSEGSSYDLTGMGKDLNAVFEGEHFTLTLTSLLADDYNVLTEYELKLDDTMQQGDLSYYQPFAHFSFYAEKNGKYIQFRDSSEAREQWVDENGSYHGYCSLMFPDQTWNDAKLSCLLEYVAVNTFDEQKHQPEQIVLYETDPRDRRGTDWAYPPEHADLRDLGTLDCVYQMQQIRLDTPVVIHNATKVRDEFHYAAVSPISLVLTEEEAINYHFGNMAYHGSDYLYFNCAQPWYGRDDGTFTVTYLDGPEEPVSGEVSRMRIGSEYFGDVFVVCEFRQPVDLQNVDHFTINDTVIPVK